MLRLTSRGAPAPAATAGSPPGALAYRAPLDGLRALAILGVLAAHLTPLTRHGGAYGVALFFVLSGYLITRILLRCRGLVERGQRVSVTLRQFYTRRFLRILPILYVVLLTGWLLGDREIIRLLWWHVAYASNILFAMRGFSPQTAHFWSLAVEEQFYLAWPFFLLLCPRRWWLGVTVVLIVGAAVFRVVAGLWWSGPWPQILTPAVVDAFAFGALAAFAEADRRLAALLACGGPIAAAIAALAFAGWLAPADPVLASAVATCRGLAFAWLVFHTAEGRSALATRLLATPALVYLGRISYGVYLYHPFVKLGFADAGLGSHLPWEVSAPAITAATIALAALSWHGLERPLNGLKRHFPYAVAGGEGARKAGIPIRWNPIRPQRNDANGESTPG